MISVSQAVNEIVSRNPFLEEALVSGLINLSSLAREIQPEVSERVNKNIENGAIMMSLKRLKPTVNFQINLRIKRIIEMFGEITVHSNLVNYTFSNSSTLSSKQKILLDFIKNKKDVFYSFYQGVYGATLITSDYISKYILDIFGSEKLISNITGLSSVTIKMPEESAEIFGVYSHILKKLAYQSINVLEIISTTHEFTIIVKEESVEKAFSVLKSLKNKDLFIVPFNCKPIFCFFFGSFFLVWRVFRFIKFFI